MNYKILLNKEVEIIDAKNPSLIGLSGIVCYQSNNNKYIKIYNKKENTYKGVSDVIFLVENKYIVSSNHRILEKTKKVKRLLSVYKSL